jgi:chondroitin sulfate synthase
LVDHLNIKYGRQSISTIKLYGDFSRGVAIDTAVQSSKISANDIIFLIDVDVVFTSLTISRIRQNTIKRRQIYLPIVFSEYNPELAPVKRPPSSMTTLGGGDFLSDYRTMSKHYKFYAKQSTDFVNNESGYFREFGYGLVSIYKCDIMNSKINGFVTDIKGWGLEDVKFLEKILTASYQVQNQYILSIAEGNEMKNVSNHNLEIFRSPDSSLWHIFHQITCDRRLEKNQHKMCLGTSASTLGNFRLLKEKYLLKNDFMEFVSRVKEIVAN